MESFDEKEQSGLDLRVGPERRRLIGRALREPRLEMALSEGDLAAEGIQEAVEIALSRDNAVNDSIRELIEVRQARERQEQRWGILTSRLAGLLVGNLVIVFGVAFVGGFVGLLAFGLSEAVSPGEIAPVAAGFALVTSLVALLVVSTVRVVRNAALRRVEVGRGLVDVLEGNLLARKILPELRAHMRDRPFEGSLQPIDTRGLGSLFDPKYEVPVAATEKLKTTLDELESGSVGIAGSRGAGKTTLIRVACSGGIDITRGERRVPVRGVVVSAPVRYDARDFTRLLFEELCLSVIPANAYERRAAAFERRLQWVRRLAFGAAQVVGAGLAIVALIVVLGEAVPRWGITFAAVLVFVIFGALIAYGSSEWGGSYPERLRKAAERNLRRLRYVETISQDWSGDVAVSRFTFGVKRGVTRAEQAWTLPDLIRQYQEFLSLLTERGPLAIGIDELDKMREVDEARSFLNDMKALFDQPNVYYLVSVSEEALSDFERRGQPIRDVFDSVFSDVIHVDRLNQGESELLLKRRAIGVPPPWPALFHSLSGGLPRESLRVARLAVRFAASDPNLEAVTPRLVAERARTVEHAVAVLARGNVQPDGNQLVLSWLRDLPQICPEHMSVEEVVASLRVRFEVSFLVAKLREQIGSEATIQLERVIMELAASSYHSLTCLEFFSELDEREFERACAQRPSGLTDIDLLAMGQENLSMSPALSWETVGDFRDLARLQRYPYPASEPAGAAAPPVSG